MGYEDDVKAITPQAFYNLGQEGGTTKLIDVRTPDEYENVQAIPSVNFPLDDLEPEKIASALGLKKSDPVYLFCRSGRRSLRAACRFVEYGFTNVYNVEGGILDWEERGLPVRRKDS